MTTYVLNVNEGIDTLHANPGERCNTDDAEDRETIDESTALALKRSGTKHVCQWCIGNWPKED
jgi:hypothetical protein